MADVKVFKRRDLDLRPKDGMVVHGIVHKGFSPAMGAGIGVLEKREITWTNTYDEILFVIEGSMSVRVEGRRYTLGPGDTLWIPTDTTLTFAVADRCLFCYAVHPVGASPTTSKEVAYPTATPE